MTPTIAPWAEIAATTPQRGELAAKLIRNEANDRVYAGVDSDGNRHVLVELRDGERGFDDRSSRGIAARTVMRAFTGEGERRFIDVECTERGAQPMLDLLAADMIQFLASGKAPPGAVAEAAFTKWRRIWAQVPKALLAKTEQVGLFTELWFLAYWLIPSVGVSSVRRWRGPLGARHDFEGEKVSVEAKATLAQSARIHVINGIDQLDSPEAGALYLFSQRLREEGGAVNSLPLLVGKIRELLHSSGEVLDVFDSTLLKAGYHDAYAEDYGMMRFRVVDEMLYLVSEDFPRLSVRDLKHGLPPSIQAVQYELNLQGQDRYIVARNPNGAEAYLK